MRASSMQYALLTTSSASAATTTRRRRWRNQNQSSQSEENYLPWHARQPHLGPAGNAYCHELRHIPCDRFSWTCIYVVLRVHARVASFVAALCASRSRTEGLNPEALCMKSMFMDPSLAFPQKKISRSPSQTTPKESCLTLTLHLQGVLVGRAGPGRLINGFQVSRACQP